MRMLGRLGTGRAEEGDDDEPGHVKCGETGGEEADPVKRGVIKIGDGEEVILAEESGERRHAAEGEHADGKGPEGEGDFVEQAAHFPDVLLFVEGVDDRAGGEEEERLEEGVGGEVEHGGIGAAATDGHDHVAELREGGIGEDALDVVLLDGDEGGEDGGEAADACNDEHPGGRKEQQRIDAAEHIDAGGDHGGGVDERGDRRRAFHGVGQPDVERDHGRFADAAAEEAEDHDGQKNVGRDADVAGMSEGIFDAGYLSMKIVSRVDQSAGCGSCRASWVR